jgi:hypothetical protein
MVRFHPYPPNKEYVMHAIVKQEYLCDVFSGWTDLDKGISSISFAEHPAFTATREMLEATGYIRVQRMWVNGDKVIKDFIFNDREFKEGEQFPCACAMGNHLTVSRKYDEI